MLSAKFCFAGKAAEDCPHEMTLDQAANLYITGYCTGKGNNFDFLTAKYNSNGVRQWAYLYNAPANKDDISKEQRFASEHNGELPAAFELTQNFPNPLRKICLLRKFFYCYFYG